MEASRAVFVTFTYFFFCSIGSLVKFPCSIICDCGVVETLGTPMVLRYACVLTTGDALCVPMLVWRCTHTGGDIMHVSMIA